MSNISIPFHATDISIPFHATDISIPFHATEGEIATWLTSWISPGDLRVVALSNRQPLASIVSPPQMTEVVCDPTVWRLLIILAGQFEPLPEGNRSFEDAHPDCLALDVGRLSEAGLGESWLAASTDHPLALFRWKQLAKNLRAKTRQGITAINCKSGERSFYKSHRYSKGALALETQGVKMIAVQGPGGPILRLGNALE